MVRKICGWRVFVLLLIIPILQSCTSIFYYPRVAKTKFYDPAQVGLHQEEVEFFDKDGTRLHGWWFNAKNQNSASKGTIIFFHGNAENLTTHFLSMAWLPEQGYNYFIFDYPNYGVSEGDPSPYTNLESGKAAIRWVNKNKDQRPLIVYGQSLGGNIAFRSVLDIKAEIPIRNLIIDASFLSYRSIARKKAASSWVTWLLQPVAWLIMSDRYAPKDISKLSPTPLLVIHGQRDKVVEPEFGEQIYNEAQEPKQIWRIPEGVHTDTFWKHNHIYRKKFIDYLEGAGTTVEGTR